jgi:hypothetical protein
MSKRKTPAPLKDRAALLVQQYEALNAQALEIREAFVAEIKAITPNVPVGAIEAMTFSRHKSPHASMRLVAGLEP